MLGNIGDHCVKCMRQVTKGHLYHLLGLSDYHVTYRHRAQSVLLNISAKITDSVADPLRWFCKNCVKSLWLEGGNFNVS